MPDQSFDPANLIYRHMPPLTALHLCMPSATTRTNRQTPHRREHASPAPAAFASRPTTRRRRRDVSHGRTNMNLYRLLQKRTEAGRPVRVGLIGAGKFGSMFLSQVPSTPGLEVAAIADLSPDRARAACRGVGWTEERIAATRFLDDAAGMIALPEVEVVVEATGHASAGIAHARQAIRHGKHIVMVNVEADVLAGPLLARDAETAGGVYSLACGGP